MFSMDLRGVQLVSDTAGMFLSAFKCEKLKLIYGLKRFALYMLLFLIMLFLSLDRVIS